MMAYNSSTSESVISTKREVAPDYYSKKSDQEIIGDLFGIAKDTDNEHDLLGAIKPVQEAEAEPDEKKFDILEDEDKAHSLTDIQSSRYLAGWKISTNDSRLI